MCAKHPGAAEGTHHRDECGDDSASPAAGPFLPYRAEDGRVKIELRLELETVWLTQQHIAALFQTAQQNIHR